MSEWVYESEVVNQILGSPRHYYPELVWKLAESAASQHARADYEHAQLAQRDGELEALRERVDEWEVFGEFAMEGAAKSFLRGIRPAALSDNQEPDALTYDEIVELAKTNPGLERFYGVDLDDDDLPDNPESPALTDQEA